MTDHVLIYLPDLIELCDIDLNGLAQNDGGRFEWYNDLLLAPAGIFLAAPLYAEKACQPLYLTRKERAALPRHPTGNYADPILTFPASLGEVRALLDEHGMSDCMDEAAVSHWLEARNARMIEPEQQADDEPPMTRGKRFYSKRQAQEEAILDELRRQKYDPEAIPIPARGLPGAKAAVKQALLRDPGMFSNKSFDLAWESLRLSKRIQDRAKDTG